LAQVGLEAFPVDAIDFGLEEARDVVLQGDIVVDRHAG
jgi:hypothetical protein